MKISKELALGLCLTAVVFIVLSKLAHFAS